ncbi:IS66 family transposase [Cupriavidus taiwanensis]|uniref:IS66 family transposase n=1 Tax=Cupriavidus taiwanensis TaxID=164546 RepID=UPI00253FE82F|nr:IS66 family transposase [Cupriavidus taiwanensis]MDK3025105.1 IS66 family transposase [Cupriavidus taiwanensis]
MPSMHDLATLDASQMREMLARLQAEVQHQQALITRQAQDMAFKQATIDKLTHENAVLKRLKFAAQSERFNTEQRSLLEETLDADLEAVSREIEALTPTQAAETERRQPKRAPLPANLPRREIRHEPENTTCACGCQMKRIGEDIAEKLDYVPGVFTVERHVRGKWACAKCETIVQAPVAPHVIDKGIPTTGLLAQVLVAKYADHLPLYRQEGIYGRAGLAVPRSTLGQWIGACGVQLQPLVEAMRSELLAQPVLQADETPVAMLDPGAGKTHRAYLWTYCSTVWSTGKLVVFDFAEGRAGRYPAQFLRHPGENAWRGTLVCDDYSGYKALFASGVSEAGCLAHARRKFHELWANHKSVVGQQALALFARLYEVEREVADLPEDERRRIRQNKGKPIADALRAWLTAQRQKVPPGSATARAIDYSLNRWAALTRYLDDARLPADNNRVENLIRPIAVGRNNWLFAGSLRAGQRAAAVMSLIHSARLNGHDPHAYLRDVLERLPTQSASRIGELLPHRWSARTA